MDQHVYLLFSSERFELRDEIFLFKLGMSLVHYLLAIVHPSKIFLLYKRFLGPTRFFVILPGSKYKDEEYGR